MKSLRTRRREKVESVVKSACLFVYGMGRTDESQKDSFSGFSCVGKVLVRCCSRWVGPTRAKRIASPDSPVLVRCW